MYVLQEIKLRATQYLPDIIQLQQFLFKRYNYNLDEEEASQLTVEDLLSGNYNLVLCAINYLISYRGRQ